MFVDKSTAAAPAGTPNDLRYFHQDQLGSVVAVTNATGGVIERLSYDAFGKRRNPDGSDSATTVLPQNDRGFTGHEMLDTVGLVHMNGRVYDPTLGRFLSADPFIQAPAATLSYQRYAYVMNNPLVLTDPSGYSWLSKTWKKLWRNEVFRIGLTIAAAWYGGQFIMGQLFEGALAAPGFSSAFAELATTGGTTSMQLTTLGSMTVGASGGFAGSLVGSGGDVKSAAQGALTGGLMGWAGTVGGAGTAGAESAARYAAHATAGCIGGAVDGSGCGRGAASAVVGKFASNMSRGVHPIGRFAIAVASGGTASVITGGKFENGARAAVYGYLFNEAMSNGFTWAQRGYGSRTTGASILYGPPAGDDLYDRKVFVSDKDGLLVGQFDGSIDPDLDRAKCANGCPRIASGEYD
ncbi:MAG: RHS repeat-associated core domain-containing protein, partial [Betaproteobacteria bacterium]|nr:RHS repeat-associated core domain-containing protein [Betaproteobacteria bacterium]